MASQEPRIQLHFTRQAVERGTFTSVKDLIATIETYIDAWNNRCKPFNLDQGRRHRSAKAVHPAAMRNPQDASVTCQ